jgi:hypothetical protein
MMAGHLLLLPRAPEGARPPGASLLLRIDPPLDERAVIFVKTFSGHHKPGLLKNLLRRTV